MAREPTGGDYWPPPSDPYQAARRILADTMAGAWPTRAFWRSSWWRWSGTQWVGEDVAVVRKEIVVALDGAEFVNGKGNPERWGTTSRRVNDVMHRLEDVSLLPDGVLPFWRPAHGAAEPFPAGRAVVCANGVLDVRTRVLHQHSPRLFNIAASPYAYQPAAPEPTAWLAFLHAQWAHDPSSILALQEWFGYCLTARTDHHKMLLIKGPMRSGKGTILRILGALVGPQNVATTSLGDLADSFGLANLNKPVAQISDARFPRGDPAGMVEKLLKISSAEPVNVRRKNLPDLEVRLPCRFVIATNDLPNIADASGALVSRFLTLITTRSFLDREDPDLPARLDLEGSGILSWALAGLDRLNRQRRFTVPESGAAEIQQMRDAASPVSAFLRDRCVIGADLWVPKIDLFAAYKTWCDEEGRHPGTLATLSQRLNSADARITPRRIGGRGQRVQCFGGVRLLEQWEDPDD